MAGVRLATLVRKVRQEEPAGSGASDADLLARFTRSRDEAAFELLVWRHGAMVLSVCRRILNQAEDAEDAFQAVFLVLARKARGVSRGRALPAWLHRVAVRVALRLARSRRPVSRLEVELPTPQVTDPVIQTETLGMLDEEIDRLSQRCRAAVVLCYLEGLSASEASQQLGCPTGTVESRLASARKRLRERLTGRGITLPVGILAMVVSQGAMAPEAIARLTRASVAFARGEAIACEASVRLARGVLHMWQARTWAGTFLVAALLALGAGLGWANRPAARDTDPPVVAAAAPREVQPVTPADAWPFARRTNRFGGHLVGIAPDNLTLVFRANLHVYGLDLSGRTELSFSVHSSNHILDAAVSSDGKYVATAEGIHGVKLRDARTSEVIEAFWPSGKLPATEVAFSPDGTRLIALGLRTDDPLSTKSKMVKGSGAFPFDPEKTFNPKVSVLAQVSVWDLTTRKELAHPVETTTVNKYIQKGLMAPTYRLGGGGRFALRTEYLLTEREPEPEGAKFGRPTPFTQGMRAGFQFTIIDLRTGKSGQPVEVKNPKLYLPQPDTVSPDGKSIVAMDETKRNEICLLDATTGKERVQLGPLLRPIKAFVFSPDGKYFAAASGLNKTGENAGLAAPSEVVIWDAATGKEQARLIDKETIRDYTALTFSPDGKFVVAQDAEGTYTLWGHPPKLEPAKPPAKAPAAAPATVPDRFKALFASLAADGVTDTRRIEGVFLAALGRLPSEVEAQSLSTQLARQSDKAAALRDLLNTLVETAEFKAHAEALGKLSK